MIAVLSSGIMEVDSDTRRAGIAKQEHAVQSCSSQASAWGNQDPSHKRKLSNAANEEQQNEAEEDPFPLQKKIKTEPKDDYELAEEESVRKMKGSTLPTEPTNTIPERWKYEHMHAASPEFDRTPSFAECHKFNDNCKQCIINEARQADIDNISLHRRRQIREFEQGAEEPLCNKIRVWKEKRLEKSHVVRGLGRAALRIEEEGYYPRTEDPAEQERSHDGPPSQLRRSSVDGSYKHQISRDDSRGYHVIPHEGSRDPITVSQENSCEPIVIPHDGSHESHMISHDGSREQHVITSEHHVSPRSRMESGSEGESGNDSERNFGYIRYLLTHNGGGGGPTIVSTEGDVEMPRTAPPVSPGKQQITMVHSPPSMPVVLTSPGVVPQDYINGIGGFPRVPLPHTQSSPGKSTKVAKKRTRQQPTGSNFLERLEKGRHESPTMASSKTKGNKKSFENGADSVIYQEDLNRGQFGQGSTILPLLEPAQGSQDNRTGEQYISDIQHPYCNIPDDHQVTHINGIMSLPATRETRYGITLGELKRRTGFPEYLTRVDLIAYVKQSKSSGRSLLDKYNISTAGQKSRPTILSKMCENEARVLGDGISRMNKEYFPWKTLARVASCKVNEGKDGEGKIDHKLKAIQNTRTMLKEMYDLVVENKDITCMKTFEVASHTFGTANILNHLTIFDRLFAEYQNNLMLRNGGEKL